jgi:5-(carboxyamino)imidazole ribonucleotide synthase
MMNPRSATLGILGGGQLGRMFTIAARTMGYDVVVLDPDPLSPARHFASHHICADYTDPQALQELSNTCVAITTEFENIPATVLQSLSDQCVVFPQSEPVFIVQNRAREKSFLQSNNFPTSPFVILEPDKDPTDALKKFTFPAIIKTVQFGYDGKGQVRVHSIEEAITELQTTFAHQAVVIETLLPLRLELSVILGRAHTGQINYWPIAENRHRNGILDMTIAPARISEELTERTIKIAGQIAEKLHYVGVLAVEFFVVGMNQLMVNEIAPRPHNSGHFTLTGCQTSQFEQQVRILCGLPLGPTELFQPTVMVNLMGELWDKGVPPWEVILQVPTAKLHLYGKTTPRPGRKMGHFNISAPSTHEAITKAEQIRRQLGIES